MDDNETRRIEIGDTEIAAPLPGTGPLDFLIPWVIELRIMGTAHVLQVKVSEYMVFGRGSGAEEAHDPDIDLSPYNAHYMGVSRKHAILTARNSRVTIRDLGSSNGTYINGGRLPANQEYRLRHGDQLTLGQLSMQVSFVLVPSSSETSESTYVDITIPEIGNGRRVLLVEDDERMVETISYVLEKAGFAVGSKSSVTSAISAIEEEPPDVVVMELMLPDHSGLDLVNYLRGRNQGEYVPVIVVTSVTGGYQKKQAEEAGVDVFLSKPIGVDEMMRGFREVFAEMS